MSIIRSILLGGPDGPRWARPVLWALLALAALLHLWGLPAEPARLLGAACGVAAVAALYGAVKEAFGHGAGTLAALVLALSPAAVGAGRTAASDSLAVLLLVLAAWAGTLFLTGRARRTADARDTGTADRAAEGGAPPAPLRGPLALAAAAALAGAAVVLLAAGGVGPAGGSGFGWLTARDGGLAWLLPFALVSLGVGLAIARGDAARTGGLLLWGGWTVAAAVACSLVAAAPEHGSPLRAVLAPGVAALAGAGAALMGRTGRPWPAVLAVCVAGTALLAFALLARTPDFQPWLRWALLAFAAGSAALLARQRLACGLATLTGLIAALAGPAAFALAAAGIIAPA